MSDTAIIAPTIGDYLFTINFAVEPVIHAVSGSPFGERKIGYIHGGDFEGPRLRGSVLSGGGNWSTGGRLREDASTGSFDARAILKTDDGALIYMTYTGRTDIPDDVRPEMARDRVDALDSSRYYLRIAPVFETGDPKYFWLNGVLAIGRGQATSIGARHHIFAIG